MKQNETTTMTVFENPVQLDEHTSCRTTRKVTKSLPWIWTD